MIKTPVTKSSPQTSKNKCIIIWLIVLSVLLIAILAALTVIGFKLYKTNCACNNNDAEEFAVHKRATTLSTTQSCDQLALTELMKAYIDEGKEDNKDELERSVKKQLASLEKKMLYEIEKAHYKTVNWSSLSTSDMYINTGAPGSTKQVYLSSLGVPQQAKEVLVFVITGTGKSYPNDGTGLIEVYSDVLMKQYVYIHSYKANDWSYNSDNFWVPIGKNRILYRRYVGSTITGNRIARIKIIGYR